MKLGGGCHASVAARITWTGSSIGVDPTDKSYVAHIALTGSDISGGSHASVAARITWTGSSISAGNQLGVVAHNTLPEFDIGGSCHTSAAAPLFLYIDIETSTNPLPPNYGFIAAPRTTKLQHGHVNPIPKETTHHG